MHVPERKCDVCTTEAREGRVGNSKRATRRETMAAGPGVSMQSGSPARELSISVQQGSSQTFGERLKTEDVTGAHHCYFYFLF